MKEVDVSSLEHTSWHCQHHVVFAPEYRRSALRTSFVKVFFFRSYRFL